MHLGGCMDTHWLSTWNMDKFDGERTKKQNFVEKNQCFFCFQNIYNAMKTMHPNLILSEFLIWKYKKCCFFSVIYCLQNSRWFKLELNYHQMCCIILFHFSFNTNKEKPRKKIIIVIHFFFLSINNIQINFTLKRRTLFRFNATITIHKQTRKILK